jgi:hypothetical protein
LSRWLFGAWIDRCEAQLIGSNIAWRLALVADSICVLRYDNEAGKGDHRHIGTAETRYNFVDPEALLKNFWNDVEAWRR